MIGDKWRVVGIIGWHTGRMGEEFHLQLEALISRGGK
jgi:hypothetical protein